MSPLLKPMPIRTTNTAVMAESEETVSGAVPDAVEQEPQKPSAQIMRHERKEARHTLDITNSRLFFFELFRGIGTRFQSPADGSHPRLEFQRAALRSQRDSGRDHVFLWLRPGRHWSIRTVHRADESSRVAHSEWAGVDRDNIATVADCRCAPRTTNDFRILKNISI